MTRQNTRKNQARKKQHIMFFYLKTGGGHLAPAKSVADCILQKHGSQARIVMCDGLEDSPRIKKMLFEDSYRLSQNYAQWVFEMTFQINEDPRVWRYTRKLITALLEDRLEEKILGEKPDKIVIFHDFIIVPVMNILRNNHLDIPVIVVVTDPFVPPHEWFASKKIDYVLSSEQALKIAVKHGTPKSRISVYPTCILNQKYCRRLSSLRIQSLKKSMRLPINKKVILLLGGGDGMPRGYQIIRTLLRNKTKAEIIIVCGRNAQLKAAADQLSKAHKNLHVYGFVDFVYELLNVSDIVITKCGASTIMEILIQGKIPIICTYLGGLEESNMRFVVKNKLGFYEPNVSRLPKLITRVFGEAGLRAELEKNLEKACIRNASSDIGDHIWEFTR